jgi:hypothetical protein
VPATPSGFFRHPKKKLIFLVDTSAAFLANKVLGQVFYLGRGKINGRKWILSGETREGQNNKRRKGKN